MERADFKDFIRAHLWDFVLKELQIVPVKYLNPNNYDFDQVVNGFLEFIYGDRTFTPQDFIGLQEMLNFTSVSRRQLEGLDSESALSVSDRDLLDLSPACEDAVYDMAINLISLIFSQITFADKVIRRAMSSPQLRARFGPAFALSLHKHAKNPTKLVGSFVINFFTTVTWSEIEDAAWAVFTKLDMQDCIFFTVTTCATIACFYASGFALAAANILSNLSSIVGLYNATKNFFIENDCFGEIRSEDCDSFQNSGGKKRRHQSST